MNIDWSLAPEGATHYHPTKINPNGISAHWFKPGHFCVLGFEAGGWVPDISPLPDRSGYFERPTEWTGEDGSLPPVGTMVELADDDRFNIRKESSDFIGKNVRVAATFTMADSGKKMVCVDGGPDLGCEVFILELIKPARTAEQIAAEERESHINGMLCHDALGGSRRGLAEALYDAGYRKQEQK